MIQVEELSDSEINALLSRVGYGHLACSRDAQPYVVPVHYAFHGGEVYIYTTEGKKFEVIRTNPLVCLQVEEIMDNQHWTGVIVDGVAEQMTEPAERPKAIDLVIAVNPTLTPALSKAYELGSGKYPRRLPR